MQITNIVSAVNAKLAGETLTYNQLRLFLNEVIDDINRDLNAAFPDFDNLNEGDEYNAFPNNYIRSVLVVGAAYKFYETDEEGIVTATQYMYDYRDGLFYMKRDFSGSIPELYQADRPGSVSGPELNTPIESAWQGWW